MLAGDRLPLNGEGGSPRRRPHDLTWTVLALLVVALYYNWYRYPFRINSTDTSPTYADTPLWLSLGKYLLVALIMAIAIGTRSMERSRLRISRPLEAVGFTYLATVPIVAGTLVAEPDIVQIGIFFVVSLVLLAFCGGHLDPQRINRLARFAIYTAVVVQILQVALFFTVGRLPALAYTDTISIRFGSFLDDPNGFGLLIAWFLPFTWAYFPRSRAAMLTVLLFGCLLLTQSLTAIAACAMVSVAYIGWVMTRGARPFLLTTLAAAGMLGVGAVAVVMYLEPLTDAWSLFLLTKQGSIVGHAESLERVQSLRALSLAGVEPAADTWGESGYANFLAFFGLAYPLIFITVIGTAVARYTRLFALSQADRETHAFAAAAAGFLLAAMLANLNLPVAEIFPLNLMIALFAGLSSAGITGATRAPAKAPTPPVRHPHRELVRAV